MRSAEDYLEAMLMMQEQHGYIRSIDIAGELNVTKPSVSYATKRLAENGFINKAQDGAITPRIYERHKVLTYLLTYLGVDEKIAREDACRLEHDLSVESFDRIRECADRVRTREEEKKAAEAGARE